MKNIHAFYRLEDLKGKGRENFVRISCSAPYTSGYVTGFSGEGTNTMNIYGIYKRI